MFKRLSSFASSSQGSRPATPPDSKPSKTSSSPAKSKPESSKSTPASPKKNQEPVVASLEPTSKKPSDRGKSSERKKLSHRSKTMELPQITVTKPPEDLKAHSNIDLSASMPAQFGGGPNEPKDPNVVKMRKQIEVLRRENSAFQVRLQQIITQLRDLQREREEHLMVIRERETLTRDLTSRIKSLESEKTEYLKSIQSLNDQINNSTKGQEVQSLSAKKKTPAGKSKKNYESRKNVVFWTI